MQFDRRNLTEKIVIIISSIAAFLVIGILFMIVSQVFFYGLPSLSFYFITTPENATPAMGQGIANAIIGTILISLCATIIATPFGFGTALYMKRYAPENKITQAFRFLLEVLSGTPSIVVGIFGFLVFVYYMKEITGGFSLIAGSLALAILIMPVMERALEEAIDTVGLPLEEGSYALGANKWQTIRHITIPAAFTGILTGFTLGFGRAAEESAVVILTAGYTQYMPELAIKQSDKLASGIKIYPIQDQVATLPYAVYHGFQNSNVVKPSAGFAAAFVLIVIVFSINILGKAVLKSSVAGNGLTGKTGKSWIDKLKNKFFPKKRAPETISASDPSKKSPEDLIKSMMPSSYKPETKAAESLSLKKRIAAIFSGTKKKSVPLMVPQGAPPKNNSPTQKIPVRTFLRAYLPFAIPAALLLLIAFLASIPPLHHALAPVSPSDARLLTIGLYLSVMIVGVVFGLLLARKAGVFKGKNRRVGFAGVTTGVCLLCIAGIICALAAPGIFSTGEQSVTKSTTDRKALLASLMAEYEGTDGGTSPAQVNNAVLSSSAPSHPAPVVNSSGGVIIPVKDALSIGESYRYGDTNRIVEATVYDYKVLPFYFWWFIDYNRFVQQVPQNGNSYLVVFMRVEDIGAKSAIVPSADMIHITNNGSVYSHEPYFNTSVLSSYQTEYYTDHFEQLPYQWVRELGQDKRDYAFLTGYNIFGEWRFVGTYTTTKATVTPQPTLTDSSTTSTSSGSSNNGKGFFIKPGPGNAIDGFLIFEVPDTVVKENLDQTYVGISFNANSGTRWRLKSGAG